jgi:NAD(P)-dependent dehydrogenase (short-subunit alcohol dehydrogenase family)
VQVVNLKSVYLCCRAALRQMAPAGKGSIVNVASFVAVMGSATSQISYTASKGGVLAMSRELGVPFARQGIRVNALCPGPVNTAAGAFRQGSRPGGTAAGARADGPLRRGRRSRRCRSIFGQRRRLVHHRGDIPGRRRYQRRLHRPAVAPRSGFPLSRGERVRHHYGTEPVHRFVHLVVGRARYHT